ncbi:MAG: 16S rRNA (guanine(966)-N(2))-methyltransferase RsmD [Syntrophobacterales bacterium CG_4_8_14_3_um_filter_58_8]|nr:MAG: 16S rRNA (guanine(966)-N(2))-methyltransferase RsmD [Syntrophaceae bacterium CG2_30_58_14]PIV06338.1 MAG: 16S rRNA (guanine(966)-N(2))-methyltransferase RsmD [Syntrophobacterales bacterium CG03_land_8_20_14_0_80_58_14]PJC75449.1 MAG: 16S rRNA (guanine(966)-N(2))-methyltransferase RsmD [Syntrophobacterales bacterium CG_4_8_14_3_um_filter_58_8]
MRIIGGEAKGRVVRLHAGSRIRPTADRVKESLFNILHSVEGRSFLDLFAGSGNVGLEALSRGARFATFVEKDIRLTRALQGILDQLGFTARAEVIAADGERGLGRLAQRGDRYDIIFTDPPYDQGLVRETLAWPDMRKALAENGIIVIQHSVRENLEGLPAQPWVVADQRRYGDTVLSFIKGTDFKSVPKHGNDL